MLSMKETGLVSGVGLNPTPLVMVRAIRGFFDEHNKARKPGEVFQCSERFARGMISVNRAERYSAPPDPIPLALESEKSDAPIIDAAPIEELKPRASRKKLPRELPED